MKKFDDGSVLLSPREYSFLKDKAILGEKYNEFFEKQELKEETRNRLQNFRFNRGVGV